jgi:hypothetical protein
MQRHCTIRTKTVNMQLDAIAGNNRAIRFSGGVKDAQAK